MDIKHSSLESILSALHTKFAGNQALAVTHISHRVHELHAVFFHVSEYLCNLDVKDEHKNLLAKYMKEIFADCVCANYLAFSGLDTSARVLTRRVLELGFVILAYYDNPAKFWDWNSNDRDISFSELESIISSDGYITFLSKSAPLDLKKYRGTVASLKSSYGKLSNVVHPKPYNFETTVDDAFSFSKDQLESVLEIQNTVHKGLLALIFYRFPLALDVIKDVDPQIETKLTS